MKIAGRFPSSLLFVTLALSAASLSAAEPDPAKLEFFEKRVRPILVSNCYSCHSAETRPAGGLRVDDKNGLLLGGNAGPAVVPSDPAKSLLIQRLTTDKANQRMPRESDPLTEEQIAVLTQWVADGAVWPAERIPAFLSQENPEFEVLKKSHWAWQPVTAPQPPEVQDKSWSHDPVDQFILAKLEENNLKPVADGEPLQLLRRVTFDLTGLPPSPKEISDFLADASPQAFEHVVDRLIGSRAFAERWGRHWLDVARYGESTGPSRNIPYPHAWKYRDYVVDAVHKDVPYNRFIEEQIAGDLLPSESKEEKDRLLTATGFLALGVKDVNQRFKTRFIMDNVDEQIDAVTRSVLALTVSCARCHDHKFDPIPMRDYYALAGIFTSTDDCAGVRNKMGGGGLDYYDPSMLITLTSDVPPAPQEEVDALKVKVEEAKKEWDAIRGTPEGTTRLPNGQLKQRSFRVKYERLQGELLALSDPASRGFAVHGVRDGKLISDTEIRIRGEAERIGPSVPRGFLSTFAVPGAPETVNPSQSGRLELAQWLTSDANPMSSRVMVNRAWKHLFGQGLVTTVDNFGITGDKPSHPELLDHLAQNFVEDGWSVKRLVRRLVLTRAYQLGSEAPETHRVADPSNKLVWRHAPRRLDAEEVRDAMLSTAGRLENTTQPPASASKELRMVEMRDNGQEARQIHTHADNSTHRSLYLPALRTVTPKTLEAFDPVSQSLVTGSRDATTVPTQALYMLNATFVRQQALFLAQSILQEHGSQSTEDASLQDVYLTLLGREASPAELERARQFLHEYEASYQQSLAEDASGQSEIQLASVSTTAAPTNTISTAEPGAAANPDDVDRTDALPTETSVEPPNARSAAWMSFIQALFASAEFRFVR